MSLIKRKKLMEKVAGILILGLFLANITAPLPIYASISPQDSKSLYSSQNTVLTNGQGPYLLAIANYQAELDKMKPDEVVQSVVLTAYTSTKDQTDDDPWHGALGTRVHTGMIAANWLPFYTKVRIRSKQFGDQIFTVEDRMNSRYGYGIIDIWMDTDRQTALNFGVQRADIEIYYPKTAQLASVK